MLKVHMYPFFFPLYFVSFFFPHGQMRYFVQPPKQMFLTSRDWQHYSRDQNCDFSDTWLVTSGLLIHGDECISLNKLTFWGLLYDTCAVIAPMRFSWPGAAGAGAWLPLCMPPCLPPSTPPPVTEGGQSCAHGQQAHLISPSNLKEE